MTSPIAHLQINVSTKESINFYKELLTYLDFKMYDEWETGFGAGKDGVGIWVYLTEEKYKVNKFHRKNTGINHLALSVGSKEDVDRFYKEFLEPKGIKPLYDSPKVFAEYASDYYSVYFEDPDRIKLEVVFHS